MPRWQGSYMDKTKRSKMWWNCKTMSHWRNFFTQL